MNARAKALPSKFERRADIAKPIQHSIRYPESATFLERALPFKELSLIATADRRAADPVYAAHRWWARRPPGVMRGLLLAAVLPANTEIAEYWRLFASDEASMQGLRVHDLFVGGGTTLVEAARLGAIPSGTDVDPLAISIVRHELERPDPKAIATAGSELLTFLETKVGHLFASTARRWTPLHYFSLYEVRCPHCETVSPLYRNLILARGSGKDGAVVRNAAIIAFCPDCFSIHELKNPDRRELRCCNRRKLNEGNFQARKFTCPSCNRYSTHRELQTGKAPLRLLAIEETAQDECRRIRSATQADRALSERGTKYIAKHNTALDLPKGRLQTKRRESKPLSFGIKKPTELFTDRQLAVFGHAFRWLRTTDHPPPIRRALTLAISNALATNNRLCGYATDYGRLAPLFSVRSYALPALPVELNPFHPSAGRGTLPRSIEKSIRSTTDKVRRYVWSPTLHRATPLNMQFINRTSATNVVCASASKQLANNSALIDLCIFDPPYFDYIAYSELSEFYRCWQDQHELGGSPLLPNPKNPSQSFGLAFAGCLHAALARLKPGRPLAFTYHSSSPEAWKAVGIALDKAKLLVTALWPIRNDSHMGHHTSTGNCEWDIIVVCRRLRECERQHPRHSVQNWKRAVAPLTISKADLRGMELAIAMATARHGAPKALGRRHGGGAL